MGRCDTRWPRPAWLAEAPPCVDPSGVIRVHTLTEETGDDATLALDRLTAVKGPLARVTADAASDTVARAGSNDPVGQDARPVPLEEGVRVPSSGPGGEHVLPRHVHHRRGPSRPESSQAGECGRPRLCDPESDDRPRPTRVISPRQMRILSVGIVRTRHDCRVAPEDCSPEALTRTGLGGFHHPALPLMWLMAMRPRFARESEAQAEGIVPTTQRTSAR